MKKRQRNKLKKKTDYWFNMMLKCTLRAVYDPDGEDEYKEWHKEFLNRYSKIQVK